MGGLGLWRAVVAAHELEPHELLLLRESCRTIDSLDALQVIIDRERVVIPWGDGSKVNPAMSEARQSRLVLARLLAALGVPSAEDAVAVAPQRGRSRDNSPLRVLP